MVMYFKKAWCVFGFTVETIVESSTLPEIWPERAFINEGYPSTYKPIL
jgi:hypothetical protein